MEKVFSYTLALCPKCRGKVNARIIERQGQVYLEKFCPQDGISYALISSDSQWYQASMLYIKPSQRPEDISVKDFQGCPDSCGICPAHHQHTCLPIIEVTTACNLNCPICLKDRQTPFQMTVKEYEGVIDRLIACEGVVNVINLSGGEPTLHPDFERLLQIPLEKGVMQTTVSTNGLRLHQEKSVRDLFKETGAIAALQFDGFRPETYQRLRGEDLSQLKQETILLLEKEGIKFSLVATIVKGLNDSEIPDIVDFFFRSKAMSLMFQPASFTGSAAGFHSPADRMTIPDVVKAIETSPFVKKGDFNPLPCSHYACFALAYYLIIESDEFMSLKEFLGKENYLKVIYNRTLPGLDREGFGIIKERIYDFWSASDSSASNERVLNRIRLILRELSEKNFTSKKAFTLGADQMKAIFIHQFMDVDTLDFGRLIKCCNHYPQVDGRLIPMCAQNVFFQGQTTVKE